EAKITVAGTPGTRTVTTTYTVNPTDGSLIPHEGKPVIKPSTPTVVKVPAKDEVEYLKEGDDVVKKTTTYAVNASTGSLTPTEKNEVFKKDGAKSKVVVTPIEPSIRYEKDATKAKGEAKITVAGTPGARTVTTTYTVNSTDGSLIPHEGKPVIKPSTPTVVKVPAKDEVEYLKEGDDVVKKTTTYAVNASTGSLTPTEKNEVFKKDGAKSKVVVTPIEPSIRYEKDATKAKGEAKITVAGTPGTRTVTTTYTVKPTDGSLIPHEGKPFIKPSTPTVVKVPAKDEVEYLKEGDDVVKKTTTYAVNASTGALTPTETTEIFNRNGAKAKVVVTSIEPSVRYEKDATKAKGEAKITVAGTPGTRTVTTTYTVNSTDGNLIPHEGKPVIKPSTPTVVKVPAKDEVEYLKEGDDVVKKTTTYAVNVSTGALTPTEKKEIFKQNGAKSKVVVTPIQPSVRYEKDATKAKGEAKITVAGTPGTRTVTTTYTVNPTDGNLIPHEEPAVVVPSKPTVVKVPAKDEVEYLKEGDDVVKKTTSYEVNASTGALTPTEKNEVFNKDGAKSKVVVTPLEPSVRYEKDATRAKGEAKITVAGTPGTRTVTTTYTVNPTDGSLIPHEEPAVVVPSKPTVVKVPAKDEIEYLKEGDDVVKKTTSYEVNASTGALTPTVRKDIASPNGVKSKVVTKIIPVTTRYEADKTKDVGTNTATNNGSEGKIVTTTSTLVNETNGTVTDGTPIVSRTEMVPKVVKVGAKDKVVETPIEPEVEYVRDVEKDFGTPDQRTEGEKGKTVTTTTYDVDPKDGHITEHVGNPVVTPAGKTIVKVGAKTKVEQSKDSEGRDVIDTTTYEVDPKTGNVTPTTVRTYGKTKEPTVEKRVVPSPVVYEKDDTKEKGTAPTTVKGEDGEDTITTTYTVDPNTGKITASEGQPVRTKEPTNTIVKVAAKDKVETTSIPSPKKYVKDDTRDKDQPNVEEAGQAGSSTTTTTYSVDSTTGAITERVGEPVVVNPTATIVKVAAKDKVVETPIEPEVEYVKDVEKDFGTPDQRTEGEKGKTVTTTTYDVDPTDGHITEHVGNPVVTPATKTIVKVGAKTKVEQSKDSEGRDVIDTTIYEVDPKTGKVTPTTVRTYGKTKEPTTETRPVPSPVVYEKDDSRDKDSEPVRKEGTPGEDTITTTYTVDPNTGKITASEGQPVRTKEPTNTIVKVAAKDKVETTEIPSPKKYLKDDTRDKDQPNVEEAGRAGSRTTTTTYKVNPADGTITERVGEPVVVNPTETIVKVPAKDKVVETPIEPEVEYVKDGEREVDTPNERVEGAKGKTVTTTTYDVDPNDGHITEHVGNPVVTPASKTIIKVGAKTKVEQSKDSEGRDVIDTTTYEVDPKTGKVTLTTVRTYGKTKEPKVELEQNPKTGDVTVTPKKPDGSTYPPGTKVEIPGKGDKLITVTIGEDGKGKVPNSELPEGKVPGTGKITEPGKPAVEVPVENPAKVTIFENGVLPASIELPELVIEVRWIDEDGNVLKSSVKTGKEKDAEHGSILGYEFVRTVIAENEPVMTHIFRKISSNTNTIPVTSDTNVNSDHDTPELTTPTPVVPVMPDANGNSGYDTAAPTTPVPDAVAPNADQVDTKTTNDNGAKSNDSQNVLPNTGTESNATLASLGLLGMLGGLGLALGKKKED
ncbi:G5 domain-containing protein, partial [Streptococcus mitis]|uniref:G5 domain-containing protein n=1 Tax=Streptococcus mitis TaxID=28037 RepID=UPI0021B7E79F